MRECIYFLIGTHHLSVKVLIHTGHLEVEQLDFHLSSKRLHQFEERDLRLTFVQN